jgi:CRISPR/Cas system-associated endonuclease Cas3-HD
MKDKAISKKLDIAKILTDVYHHNGDVKGAIENGENIKNMDFNFDDIKKMIDNNMQEEKTKTIELNKK